MMNHDEVKARLKLAFAALRKEGFIARQNYLCCNGCAGAQIATSVEEMAPEKRAKLNGAVFYNRQDNDSFKRNQPLYIKYGSVEVDGQSYGKPMKEIGEQLSSTLRLFGLEIEWDGNPNTAVMVTGATDLDSEELS